MRSIGFIIGYLIVATTLAVSSFIKFSDFDIATIITSSIIIVIVGSIGFSQEEKEP